MINTTYKLISKLNLKNATYGQYFEKEQIDTERLKVMYSIYEQYYENTRFSIFVDDFKNKSGAILIFDSETDEIVGFSTVVVQHFYLNGKDYTVLFSGDTVILKKFWGTRTLQSTMLKLMIKLRIKYPFNELYWLLISKGYKTYLLLPITIMCITQTLKMKTNIFRKLLNITVKNSLVNTTTKKPVYSTLAMIINH